MAAEVPYIVGINLDPTKTIGIYGKEFDFWPGTTQYYFDGSDIIGFKALGYQAMKLNYGQVYNLSSGTTLTLLPASNTYGSSVRIGAKLRSSTTYDLYFGSTVYKSNPFFYLALDFQGKPQTVYPDRTSGTQALTLIPSLPNAVQTSS